MIPTKPSKYKKTDLTFVDFHECIITAAKPESSNKEFAIPEYIETAKPSYSFQPGTFA